MLELLKDYKKSVLSHYDKTNVIKDARSRLSIEYVSHVEESKTNLVKDVHRLYHLWVQIEDSPNGCMVVNHTSE